MRRSVMAGTVMLIFSAGPKSFSIATSTIPLVQPYGVRCDEHSAAAARINEPLRDIEAWFQAFDGGIAAPRRNAPGRNRTCDLALRRHPVDFYGISYKINLLRR